jgi:peptidoglycan/xylan/chitin deacetylase (PgdA/CDA1 family)
MKLIFISLLFFIVYNGSDKSFAFQNLRSGSSIIYNPVVSDQIPVLCYHNIKKNSSKEDAYTISEDHFNEQMQFLYKNNFYTVSPDQLYQHLTFGTALPSNPIMISFDDSHEEHFSIAKPILDKYGFKGVFFLMTICINKPNYLTESQIKQLSDEGHSICNHTWDHQKITLIEGELWEQEIDKPKLLLEKITGKPVEYFAYPYGIWDSIAIDSLKKSGIKLAFQLSRRMSKTNPNYTIRRLMVSGLWPPAELEKQIEKIFQKKIDKDYVHR